MNQCIIATIQEIFTRIQKAKKKQKDLRSVYADALKSSLEYQEIAEKLKTFREKKKQIELATKEQFKHELTALEDIKIDIASDMEMLTDLAMNQLMKGESIEIKDEYENTFAPVFKVTFKKTA